jgi:hypothetical protein
LVRLHVCMTILYPPYVKPALDLDEHKNSGEITDRTTKVRNFPELVPVKYGCR